MHLEARQLALNKTTSFRTKHFDSELQFENTVARMDTTCSNTAESLIPTGYLRISITDSCNMKCSYCHNEGQIGVCGRFMTVDQFRQIISNALRFGLRKVRLTGGEPLLHPQCLDMLRIAKDEARIATVGFNSNGTMRNKLLRIVRENLVDKLVIGLDYQDAKVSKQSQVGLPSSVVLETIVMAKALGQDVAIACVFDGNYRVVEDLVSWCLGHEVTLKILQVINNDIETSLDRGFAIMTERLMEEFALDQHFLGDVGDYYGVGQGGTRIFFFHSHCRLRECDKCGTIHMRVTSDGCIKTCIQEDLQFPLLGGNFDRSLMSAIANVGYAPETRRERKLETDKR